MTGLPRLHLLTGGLEDRARGLLASGVLSPADLFIVDTVAARFGEDDSEVLLGLAFAVRAPRAGHVGVHLPSIPNQVDDERPTWRLYDDEAADLSRDWPPDLNAWEGAVRASPMVGNPEDTGRPFVRQLLDDGRTLILTRRMWREQERLAEAVRAMCESTPSLPLADEVVAAGVDRLFGDSKGEGARAVKTTAKSRLTVITGGPGTGKTYSIKRLLALLIESLDDDASPLRIELAAPTGKAAVRMKDAIAEGLDTLSVEPMVRDRLAALKPKTLHKLLGMRPDGTSRHGRENPLGADLVVVDEASMVDLALMRRLFEAIPDGARLLLLGDRDQLASVEAGTVLADFVGPVLDENAAGNKKLCDAVVPFATNHRFKDAPTIAKIAEALRGGDDRLEQVVRSMTGMEPVDAGPMTDRIAHLGVPSNRRPDESQLDQLAAPYLWEDGFIGLLAEAIRAHGPGSNELRDRDLHKKLLSALEDYRVLAVHRRGPLGVGGLERELVKRSQHFLEQAIREHRRQEPGAPVKIPNYGEHWLGRPILVTENSYETGLMNGDIGLVLPTQHGLEAVFPVREEGIDTVRPIALARLPEHMGAFAMTVHKSQGSQFRRVALVLAGTDSPIQTRELIYTAITRTTSRLDWLGDPEELQSSLRRRVARASGLGDLLWRG